MTPRRQQLLDGDHGPHGGVYRADGELGAGDDIQRVAGSRDTGVRPFPALRKSLFPARPSLFERFFAEALRTQRQKRIGEVELDQVTFAA